MRTLLGARLAGAVTAMLVTSPMAEGGASQPLQVATTADSDEGSSSRADRIPWLSGGAGDGTIADGSFAAWRGRDVDIAVTWNDASIADLRNQWSLSDGGDYGSWQGKIDNSIGAFFDGGSWAAAASGEYDADWTAALRKMEELRRGDRGAMFIRFAHEFNGDWFPWSVHPGQERDFKTAWRRFADLRDLHYPRARLVWSPNDGTSSGIHTTRDAWPGRRYVDVIGVDSYNWYPHVPDESSFRAKIHQYQTWDFPDLPLGLETWRLFAQSKRLPLSVPEWSNRATGDIGGESPEYMTAFHNWLLEHGARNKPGKVWYEGIFNIGGYGPGNQYQLWPDTDQPLTAARYRALW